TPSTWPPTWPGCWSPPAIGCTGWSRCSGRLRTFSSTSSGRYGRHEHSLWVRHGGGEEGAPVSALVVARWTVLEARRRRLVLAGVLLSVAFGALFAVGFPLLYHTQERDLAQAAAQGAGPAAGLNGREELLAISTILVLLGLYGVQLLAASVVGMSVARLLAARVVAGSQPADATRAVGLMVLEVLVLLAVSLLGSTVLPTLANGVVMLVLFGLAWLGGIIGFVGTIPPGNERL